MPFVNLHAKAGYKTEYVQHSMRCCVPDNGEVRQTSRAKEQKHEHMDVRRGEKVGVTFPCPFHCPELHCKIACVSPTQGSSFFSCPGWCCYALALHPLIHANVCLVSVPKMDEDIL